jgi:branched-chain amino acid transport system ATP-binding protein
MPDSVATASATTGLDGRSRGDAAPALALRGVSVNFGGIQALSEVTGQIEEHEVVAIVGPNGAGKTTLLNAVSGLIRKNTKGEIDLFGESILGKSPYAISKHGVGRSFQDPPLLDKESAVENILVGAHLNLGYNGLDQMFRRHKMKRVEAAARERVARVLEFTGLSDVGNVAVGGLPYGARKLIDIARALVSDPKILFLDEPTSGLDADEQKVVSELLLELRRRREMTVVIIEHHMDLVRRVATKVWGLQAGTVLAVGTPSEVLDSVAFRAAVVGADDSQAPSGADD